MWGLLFLNEVLDNSVRYQIKEKLPSYFNLEANIWECTEFIERSLGYLWWLLFMRFTRRLLVFRVWWTYLVSISFIFCTLFAKDASIQMGISLLPVLQLTKFVADLDYTVCQTSIKMITEKYNTAMYMMTWRWQFMKITVRWIFFRSHECFMMVYDGYMMVSWYFLMTQLVSEADDGFQLLFLPLPDQNLQLPLLAHPLLLNSSVKRWNLRKLESIFLLCRPQHRCLTVVKWGLVFSSLKSFFLKSFP